MIPIEMYCIMLNYTLRVKRQRAVEGGAHAACPKYISKFGVIEPVVERANSTLQAGWYSYSPEYGSDRFCVYKTYPDLTTSIRKPGPDSKSLYSYLIM